MNILKIGNGIYNLNGRDEQREMKARYDAMVYALSDILNCGVWDVEYMFDSENNIGVGEIIKRYTENTGELPSWNSIYYGRYLILQVKTI